MVTVEADVVIGLVDDPHGDRLAGLDLEERHAVADLHARGAGTTRAWRGLSRPMPAPRASRCVRVPPWAGSSSRSIANGRPCCRWRRASPCCSRPWLVGGRGTVRSPILAMSAGLVTRGWRLEVLLRVDQRLAVPPLDLEREPADGEAEPRPLRSRPRPANTRRRNEVGLADAASTPSALSFSISLSVSPAPAVCVRSPVSLIGLTTICFAPCSLPLGHILGDVAERVSRVSSLRLGLTGDTMGRIRQAILEYEATRDICLNRPGSFRSECLDGRPAQFVGDAVEERAAPCPPRVRA